MARQKAVAERYKTMGYAKNANYDMEMQKAAERDARDAATVHKGSYHNNDDVELCGSCCPTPHNPENGNSCIIL